MIMTTEKNRDRIEKLLDVVEHTERYSEQEIDRLLGTPEVSRETIDEEWRKFAANHYHARRYSIGGWRKAAAVFAGVVALSGIAIAAIHISGVRDEKPATVDVAVADDNTRLTAEKKSVAVADTVAVMRPRQFENVALSDMLDEMSAYYGVKVEWRSDRAKSVRLYFRWNPQDDVKKVVEAMNMFDKVDITVADGIMIVE